MEAVEEGDELLATRRVHRELQGSLDGLGAAVGEVRLCRAGDGDDLFELACKVGHVAVVVVGAAHVDEARGLLLNRFDHFRVAVASGADGDAGVAVEEDVAVHVLDPDARGAFGDELVLGARVRGREPARVGGDDLLRAGPGSSVLISGLLTAVIADMTDFPPVGKARAVQLWLAR